MVAAFLQPHDICEWLRLNMNCPGELRYRELADQLPPLPDNFHFDDHEPDHLKDKRAGTEPAKGGWDEQQWRLYRWSYYRHIEMVDGEIGRLLHALEDSGQEENTVILFTADHGEGLGHHQTVRKSLPYDEACRVPMLVSWPGHIHEGITDATHLVSGLDVVPTLCDYAGIQAPPNMRGLSVRPLLEGTSEQWRSHIVSEMPGNVGRMVRTNQYKYITYVDDPVDQLFDMENDPGEKHNLAGGSKHASEVSDHRRLLREWESKLDLAPNLPHLDAWWRST